MIQLIGPDQAREFADDVASMYRLRYRVFKERLGWDVNTIGALEVDGYDGLNPYYLIMKHCGSVQGCVRLLPTAGPNMLRDTFPELLNGTPAPEAPDVWESSRFALDVARHEGDAIAKSTFALFAGMVEFGIAKDLSSIVTVTDIRMERILRRSGWPLRRIGEPHEIGKTKAVAGHLEVSHRALRKLRKAGGLEKPVVWAPLTATLL